MVANALPTARAGSRLHIQMARERAFYPEIERETAAQQHSPFLKD